MFLQLKHKKTPLYITGSAPKQHKHEELLSTVEHLAAKQDDVTFVIVVLQSTFDNA